MKKSRFSEEQILGILREGAGETCLGTPFTLFQGAAFFDRSFTLVTPPHLSTGFYSPASAQKISSQKTKVR